MDIAGVSQEASVKVQKANEKQFEKVTTTILNGVEEAAQSAREFHSTGHSLNIVA